MRHKVAFGLPCFLLFSLPVLFGQAASSLAILPEDLRIAAREDGGYDLFIRKKEGIKSVMLTESTKDPSGKADNYAYRATEYNSVNGDEKRLLDGKFIPPSSGLYSLISSTPRPDPVFGEAFHILIPPVLVYGYSWSRSGSVAVGKGTFINIRSFAKPYGDYTGLFLDNPYEISLMARTVTEPPVVEQAQITPPNEVDDTSSRISALIPTSGKSLDLVICLDTTDSMKPYIEEVKRNLSPLVRKRVSGFTTFRIGVVLYRDYWPDDYITLKMPFTSDFNTFDSFIKGVRVFGGMDIPEAMYEAIVTAANDYDWNAESRQIIIVSDAPPHPEPKGRIGFAEAAAQAAAKNIMIEALIEPVDFPAGASEAARKAARESGSVSPYAKITRSIAFTLAQGAQVRVLALSEDETERKRLETVLRPALTPDPHLTFIGAGIIPRGSARSDAVATARSAGATHLVVSELSSYPNGIDALCEIRTYLIETSSGKVLVTDVEFRTASSTGQTTSFLDGVRVK